MWKNKEFSSIGTYIDGNIDFDYGNVDVTLIVNNEILKFAYATLSKLVYCKEIPLNKVISCNIKTEKEITKEVTLGRLLIFGIFAFGLKKKKETTTKYIIIRFYDECKEEKVIIIECSNRFTECIVDEIIKRKQNYIEQVNIEEGV